MAKEYDATTKQLLESYPGDWLAFAGLPVPPGVQPQVVDAELSSITAAADKLIRVGGAEPYLAHLELQSGADPHLDARVLLYIMCLGGGGTGCRFGAWSSFCDRRPTRPA